jgi:hypothetical protein
MASIAPLVLVNVVIFASPIPFVMPYTLLGGSDFLRGDFSQGSFGARKPWPHSARWLGNKMFRNELASTTQYDWISSGWLFLFH